MMETASQLSSERLSSALAESAFNLVGHNAGPDALHAAASEASDSKPGKTRAKGILNRWRVGSTTTYFAAWRRVAIASRAFAAARARVVPYVRALSKRPAQRTAADLQMLYGFLVEKDARFRRMPRYEAIEVCRKMRAEEYDAGETIASAGEDDGKVYVCVYGAASEWAPSKPRPEPLWRLDSRS